MNEILKLFYKSTDTYRHEASECLPRALLTIRDSMIEQDRILSEGLTVETKRRVIDGTSFKISRKRT
jgi:hypothetical protein